MTAPTATAPEAPRVPIDTLHSGDTVEATYVDSYGGGTHCVRGKVHHHGDVPGGALMVGGKFLSFATSIELIKRADPGCPFPEGATLRVKCTSREFKEWEWKHCDTCRKWKVRVGPGIGGCLAPERLEVVPSCPFVVGQAVRHRVTGATRIVIGVNDRQVDLRAVNAPHSELIDVCAGDYEPIPEPPVGTPVWWGAKWLVGYPDGERILYRRLDTIRRMNDPVWSLMLGAIPAEIPGGAK